MDDLGEELKLIYNSDGIFTFDINPGVVLVNGRLGSIFYISDHRSTISHAIATDDISLLSGTTEDSIAFLETVSSKPWAKVELRIDFDVKGFVITDLDYIYDAMKELVFVYNVGSDETIIGGDILFHYRDESGNEGVITLSSNDVLNGIMITPEAFSGLDLYKVSVFMKHTSLIGG